MAWPRYFELDEFDKAMSDLTAAIELNPNDAEAFIARGMTYAEQDDLDKAIGDYSSAIKIDPENAVALSKAGRRPMRITTTSTRLSPIATKRSGLSRKPTTHLPAAHESILKRANWRRPWPIAMN